MPLKLKALAVLLLLSTVVVPQFSFALGWQDLWLTKNQQAAKLYSKGELKKAAGKFTNPLWSGVSNYRTGKYEKAIKAFEKQDTPLANYNRGNALVHSGQYQQAIAAYDRALKQNPNLKDALYNKKLLEKLLKQNSKKKKQSSNSENSDKNRSKNKKNNNNNSEKKDKDKNKNKENKNGSSQSKKQNSSNPSSNNQNKNQNQKKSQPQQSQQNTQQQSRKQSENQKNSNPEPKTDQTNNKSENKNQNQNQNQPYAQSEQKKDRENQQQALKQWLQQIPDDPGGLLREKFLRDHWRLKMKEQPYANE